MISSRAVVAVVLVFALIGFAATLVAVDESWAWLRREGYSNYILLAGAALAAIIGEIILYTRQGWKAAVIAPIAIALVLAVFWGIIWAVGYVFR